MRWRRWPPVPGRPAPGCRSRRFGTVRRASRHLFSQLARQPGGHAQAGGSRVSARRAELRGDATRRRPARWPRARPWRGSAGRRRRMLLMNPAGLPREPGESQIALVSAPHVVLTGSQVSFGYREEDARLAFERLRKVARARWRLGRRCGLRALLSAVGGNRGAGAQSARESSSTTLVLRPAAWCCSRDCPRWKAGFAVDLVAVKRLARPR